MATVKQLFTLIPGPHRSAARLARAISPPWSASTHRDIGDVHTDPENPVELDPIEIDPPTCPRFPEASTSPLVGRDGDIAYARQPGRALVHRARENNVTMRIE